jgi:hypothetical protein
LKLANIILLFALILMLYGCPGYTSQALFSLGFWDDHFEDVNSAVISGDKLILEASIRRDTAHTLNWYYTDPIERCGSFDISSARIPPQTVLDASLLLKNPVIGNIVVAESDDVKIVYHGVFSYSEDFFSFCPSDIKKKSQNGLNIISTDYPGYIVRSGLSPKYVFKKDGNTATSIADPKDDRLRKLSEFILYDAKGIYYVYRSSDRKELHVLELKSPEGHKERTWAMPFVLIGSPFTLVFDTLTSPIQIMMYWNSHGCM